MEILKPQNNWIIILVLIGLALVMVYWVLPRLFKSYSTEKGIKLALIYGMMGYLSYDFYLNEKYYYIAFFAIGAALYTYLIVIAKKK